MHRTEDDSKYLLYIEPKAEYKAAEPVNDKLTELITNALMKSKKGASHYSDKNDNGFFIEGSAFRGFHMTECCEQSTNCDYLLENGMITNSLCVFYLQWYRTSIPKSEMKKLNELFNFYENKKGDK